MEVSNHITTHHSQRRPLIQTDRRTGKEKGGKRRETKEKH
jgi:hypothetical protein